MQLVAGLATLLLDDVGELLDLALGAEECAETLLGELLGLLVLGVTEQFHNTLLVGGESSDLTDDVLDEGLLLAVVSDARRLCGMGLGTWGWALARVGALGEL